MTCGSSRASSSGSSTRERSSCSPRARSGREEFKAIRDPEDVQKTIYHQGEMNQQRMFRPSGTTAVPQAPSGAPMAPSTVTELERLADLRAKGVLTEEEFQAQKARILRQA